MFEDGTANFSARVKDERGASIVSCVCIAGLIFVVVTVPTPRLIAALRDIYYTLIDLY